MVKSIKTRFNLPLMLALFNVFTFKSKALMFCVAILLITSNQFVLAQEDSLTLSNGDVIVGELKEMRQNIATVKTSYSEGDFKISWDKINKLNTSTSFIVTLKSGKRVYGLLKSHDDGLEVVTEDNIKTQIKTSDIVFLKQIKTEFWRNLNASLSVGFNFTKANNLSQYSVRSNVDYRARRWSGFARYNHIVSSQDNTPTTERLDANLVYNYFLERNWFLVGEVNWLSNTIQNVNLRTVTKAGLGRYLVQNNSLYWGLQTGLTFNNESFSNLGESITNNSSEAFLGTEAKFYNIGDLNLSTRIVVYPSLTESGRWRSDFNFDVRYDLPLDFFINFGVSLNYDNQPVLGGDATDYVFQTTVGWSF
jgi:small nuclear ribonucleoprotein (snRNP)-like protein